MTEPTDIAGLMALVDQLVEHAREDDRMCYDQAPSQRFQDARDELQAALAKWGTPAPVGVEPVALITVETSLRFRLANAKEDVEQLEVENRELRGRVAELKAANQVLDMGREPLTKAQRTRLFRNRDMAGIKAPLAEAEWHRIVQYIEVVHHIKQGGQHGAE